MTDNVKIIVQHNSPMRLYGKVDIQAAKTAVERLSGEAFKIWVQLCLNQNGYTANIPYNQKVIEELEQSGYLFQSGNGNMIYSDTANGLLDSKPVISTKMKQLLSLYGLDDVSGTGEAEYVRNRCTKLGLSHENDAVLEYWLKVFDGISQPYHKAKNPFRYDCTVVLVRYLYDNSHLK